MENAKFKYFPRVAYSPLCHVMCVQNNINSSNTLFDTGRKVKTDIDNINGQTQNDNKSLT
jgi:hypothetical protein